MYMHYHNAIAPGKAKKTKKKIAEKILIFFLFLLENICCNFSLEALIKALLMSIYNICFS